MSGPVVIRSIESSDGTRCVDLFRRADGSFGFEEYRRDPEDPRGWAAIGDHTERVFHSAEEVEAAARAAVAWLGHGIGEAGRFS